MFDDLAVIFDLDGTLIDSVPDLQASANFVLQSQGKEPLERDVVQGFVGRGVPNLVRQVMQARGIDDGLHGELVAMYHTHYSANPIVHSKPYPMMEEVLSALSDGGATLAICTNKPEEPTRTIVDQLGWADLFSFIIGGDSLPVKKPDPAPLLAVVERLGRARSVFVGDSEVDCATAEAAGVPMMLFEGGYRKTPVEQLPHDVSFARYSSFMAALGSLLQKKSP